MNLVINAAEAVSDDGTITVTTGHQGLTAADLSAMRVGQDARPGNYAFLRCAEGREPGRPGFAVHRLVPTCTGLKGPVGR
jgi:hypothetical protein